MSETMKALVKHHAGYGAELHQVPIPKPQPGEVLIEVKATTICGTDVHIYQWDDWAASKVKPPLVFGHEFSGKVVELGAGVTSLKVGDYVSAETHIVCHHCPQCLRGEYHVCSRTKIIGVDTAGCFAEYAVMPSSNLWKNNHQIPHEVASAMEPMGNAVHTALSGPVAGKSVVVIGCGPIGVMAVAVAKASGASLVVATDVNDYRLQLASKMGATQTINAKNQDPVKAVWDLTNGWGIDVVLEMSGNSIAIRQGFQMLTGGGRISLLGLPPKKVELDISNDIVFKGIQVHGIIGRKMFETWQQTSSFLESGQVDLAPMITHKFPIDQYEKAFEQMISGQSGKVVLYPS